MDHGAGRPIVLIHGLSGQMHNFAPALVDRLAADHRVILIDRPGSGYSAPLADGTNTLAGQTDVVAGLIAPATQPRDSAASAFSAISIRSEALRRFVSLTFATPLGLLIFERSARSVFAPDPMPEDFGSTGGSLFGREDQVLDPARHGESLRDAVPGATLTEINGGHMIVFTASDAVAKWILKNDQQLEQTGLEDD